MYDAEKQIVMYYFLNVPFKMFYKETQTKRFTQ